MFEMESVFSENGILSHHIAGFHVRLQQLEMANAIADAIAKRFGTTGSTAGEKTYYFDDMKFGPAVSVVPVNVTFRVDMQNVADPYTTPEVNGTFNNWCGGCAPMTDTNGDDIWELTIPLNAGTYEYKFAYDAWAGSEDLTPGSPCTVTLDAFTNRLLTVSANATLDEVCWGSCEACVVGVEDVLTSGVIDIFPNPAADHITINLNQAIKLPATLSIINSLGQIVSSQPMLNAAKNEVNISHLADGVYFIRVYADDALFKSPVAKLLPE